MNLLRASAVAVVIAAIPAQPALALPPLQGQVVSARDGAPIEGAQVVVRSAYTGRYVGTAASDDTGAFLVTPQEDWALFSVEEYFSPAVMVTVEAQGFKPSEFDYRFAEGAQGIVIRLVPEGSAP